MSFWQPPPAPPTKSACIEPFLLLQESMYHPFRDKLQLLDAYFDNGGNFIDTANNYQDETSEIFIGEWAEKRNIRDQLVIATKFTTNFKARQDAFAQKPKKLRTTYIDILYMHWWDWDTGVEEVMNGLHNLVVQGKVLYLGVSDTPAWVVAQANQYARDHGKTPFVIYQGRWNVLRDPSNARLSDGRAHGLALAPFSVVGGGKFRTDAEEEQRRATGEKGRMLTSTQWERSENEVKISHALEKVAGEVGPRASPLVLAIAYVMQKVPYCFPIIGGRKVEHLMANIEALDISLSSEQIAYLESVVPFEPGFPTSMIVGDGTKSSSLMGNAGHFVKQPLVEPIRPTKN
ncbi:NADP-dependent oxidoreductase domain-containing protein [Mycena leptocephala]|nr:NADP-dependent oxidoreductase domain-containing protein [Mycena leptocephala]